MQFPVQIIAILGYIVSSKGMAPDPEKSKAIAKLFSSMDVHTLRSFLGCCNYYECFIPRYGHISVPLMDLLSTSAEWLWVPV